MRRMGFVGLAMTAALAALGGCQTVGPKALGVGRERYNNILQSTAKAQTMSNIVRVYDHELPMFMDVTEVDSTLSVGGSLTGAATGISAKQGSTTLDPVESVTGVVQYSETPTIRYQPLLGQALVAQLVTPVSVDALGLMYDSNWDIGPLLDLSSAYLTLDHREFYAALDTISELNSREALELAAAKSTLSAPDASAAASAASTAAGTAATPATPAKSSSAGNDALVLYLLPFHHGAGPADLPEKQRVVQLWVRLFRIYLGSQAGRQPAFTPPAQCATMGLTLDETALRNWDVDIAKQIAAAPEDQRSKLLDTARSCLPTTIELRVLPAPAGVLGGGAAGAADFTSRAPLMRTYSALGILRNATQRPGPKIEFVTPEAYSRIRQEPWNTAVDRLSYYTLLSTDLDSVDCSDARRQGGGCDTPPLSPEQQVSMCEINRWILTSAQQTAPACKSAAQAVASNYQNGLDVYETDGADTLAADAINMNGALGILRRYMLVIVDDHLPKDSVYASFYDDGRWYYIEKGDAVSEKNFQLLSLFMTMMAVPPSTTPLSPVINVGG